MRCSIVVPAHGHPGLTRDCLERLLDQRLPDTEIVVADDASPDPMPAVLAAFGGRIRVVRGARPAGFSAACNAGAEGARGEALVFLNNDTLPLPGWLDMLEAHAHTTGAAIVGATLIYPDHSIQHAGVVICRDGNPRHLYAGFPRNHAAARRSRSLQAVTAACMWVRRDVFRELGGFDTAFHNGYEDVDFCLRAGSRGHRTRLCHDAVVVHLERATRADRAPEEDRNNRRLYRERWAHRLAPDEFRHYSADRLVEIDHIGGRPALSVAPELAVPPWHAASGPSASALLARRSHLLSDLRREVARLRTFLAEYRPEREVADSRTRATLPPGPVEGRDGRTWEGLVHAHASLARLDDRIIAGVHRLQRVLARASGVRARATAPFDPGEVLPYCYECHRVRTLARALLPPGSIVAVASHGDDRLLQLDGLRGWHFPRADDGRYVDHHPSDSAAAVNALEAVRSDGAEFLVLPRPATWWLDSYPGLRTHLDRHYTSIVRTPVCVLYDLRTGDPAARTPAFAAAGARAAS